MNTKLQVMKAKPKKLRTAKPKATADQPGIGAGYNPNATRSKGMYPIVSYPGAVGSPIMGKVKNNIA